jgi:hypothetical protein
MAAALKLNSRNIANPQKVRRNSRHSTKFPIVESENSLQRAVANLIAHARHPLALMWHVPNGGKRDKITAKNLQRDGVLAGVSDWFGFNGHGCAVALELKKSGGVLSDNQKWFRDQCERAGVAWACVDNIDDATEFLARHGIVRISFPATKKEKAEDLSSIGRANATDAIS